MQDYDRVFDSLWGVLEDTGSKVKHLLYLKNVLKMKNPVPKLSGALIL